jgi:hypothetical protein
MQHGLGGAQQGPHLPLLLLLLVVVLVLVVELVDLLLQGWRLHVLRGQVQACCGCGWRLRRHGPQRHPNERQAGHGAVLLRGRRRGASRSTHLGACRTAPHKGGGKSVSNPGVTKNTIKNTAA